MLNLWLGRAGSGKSDRIYEEICTLGDSSQQILIVPEHTSYRAEVELCRRGGDGVSRHAEVLSFRRLWARVQLRVGAGGVQSLDAGGRLLTLQRALKRLAPSLQVYRRASKKPAFLTEMVRLFEEFIAFEVQPEALLRAAGALQGSDALRLRDLSMLFTEYLAALNKQGLDQRDAMTLLTEYLDRSDYIAGKDLYFDGFSYFTRQEREVLAICMRRARSVTVTLLMDPESHEEMFAPVELARSQLRRIAEEQHCRVAEQVFTPPDACGMLAHAERWLFSNETRTAENDGSIRILEAGSIDHELERVASEIRRLVFSGECRYRDITVTAKNTEDYLTALQTTFERYEIPVYLSRRSTILDEPMLTLIFGALAAIGSGYRYGDMFRYLKSGLASLSADECDRLENYCILWNIQGSKWLRDEDWTDSPEGLGKEIDEKAREKLAEINDLRRRVRAPLKALADGIRSAPTALGKIEVLYSFLETLRLPDTIEEQRRDFLALGAVQRAEELGQLWEILCRVLDQFALLLGQEEMGLDEFEELLKLLFSQYSIATIPATLDQVNFCDLTRNERRSGKVLFLLGANDTVLPGDGGAEGLLSASLRTALLTSGIELAPEGLSRVQLLLQNIYAAVAQPEKRLYVSYPVMAADGTALRPSFVVERLRTIFPGLKAEPDEPGEPWHLTAPLPALETAGQRGAEALRDWFSAQGREAHTLGIITRSQNHARGALSPASVRALYQVKNDTFHLSASRIESLRSCHYAYFMKYGLQASERSRAELDAPQIGTFLHYLFEHVISDVRDRGGLANVDDDEVRALTGAYMEAYEQEKLAGNRGRNARFRYLFQRLRVTAESLMLQAFRELRVSDFTPRAFELNFGKDSGDPRLEVSDGAETLAIRGAVDRVDGWLHDGRFYLKVVDYKSGKKSFSLADLLLGLDTQMLLYLFTLQEQGAKGLPAEGDFREVVPAGVLYTPAYEDILSTERNISPEELAAKRLKEAQRKGLVLLDPAVIEAMEHGALEKAHYLPVNLKCGRGANSVATAEQLGKLRRYLKLLLREILHEVGSGDISADPWRRTEDDSACRYCAYKSACYLREGAEHDHYRRRGGVNDEEAWAAIDRRLGEEGGSGRGEDRTDG